MATGFRVQPQTKAVKKDPADSPIIIETRRATHLRIIWPRCPAAFTILLLGALATMTWGRPFHFFDPPDTHRAQTQAGMTAGNLLPSESGPWGELEVIRINTEPPEEYVSQRYRYGTVRWFFGDYSRERIIALFRSAGLDEAQQKALWGNAYSNSNGTEWIFRPDAKLLLDLSPESRKVIYLALGDFERNAAQYDPFRWRAEALDEWFLSGSLSDETINLVKKLLFYRGQAVLFADPELVLSTIRKPEERLQLLKTLSRQSTLLVKLKIQPDSSVDALVDYWGKHNRSKDISALLNSLVKVPGGCTLDIVHLLPRFARQRLYTYPILAKGVVDPRYDCHWSSMNFWNDPPDNRLGEDPSYAKAVLTRDYESVSEPYEFGDLIFIANAGNTGIHSAVYIADDIVFTKNGSSITSPWIFMKLPRMLAYYANQGEDLHVLAYRRK